ncbi:DUF934 domain-containing protein [Haliea sp. E1-2-M8]|uniref:DUF934 domain-containing protein n=1 Tax=Haliea sp. E1-2-M8 TaxID=3064706 RepID=UPI0027157276|nr:DUF934 domain-containing protein [Haliea sp. E1-2-M8]MDO8862343.1 DUF934 domain-containing protein [Haliea sp. E1-2-M8]
MPKLIKQGEITSDAWLPPAADAATAPEFHLPTLGQWQDLADKTGSAVQIEPGDGIAELLPALDAIGLVAVHFPLFTDGRGFSYGRELRQRGYRGELRAVGTFLPDQLHYLRRCGFDAFQFSDESRLEEGLRQLDIFSEHYQGAIDEPQPLFRRRH